MRDILRCFSIVLPLLAGCASGASRGDLGTLTYRAVDQIVAATPGTSRENPIVVASISDVQSLESSALGNIIADMVRTRLVQDGVATSEIRLRNAVRFRENDGEFLLSRNPHSVLPPRMVTSVVTGTYSASPDRVYISLKLISAIDAHIIAGVDYVIPYDEVGGMMVPRRS